MDYDDWIYVDWIEELLEKASGLSEEKQTAMRWGIYNFIDLDMVIQRKDITEEELERCILEALHREDYYMFMILCHKKLRDQELDELD